MYLSSQAPPLRALLRVLCHKPLPAPCVTPGAGLRPFPAHLDAHSSAHPGILRELPPSLRLLPPPQLPSRPLGPKGLLSLPLQGEQCWRLPCLCLTEQALRPHNSKTQKQACAFSTVGQGPSRDPLPQRRPGHLGTWPRHLNVGQEPVLPLPPAHSVPSTRPPEPRCLLLPRESSALYVSRISVQ